MLYLAHHDINTLKARCNSIIFPTQKSLKFNLKVKKLEMSQRPKNIRYEFSRTIKKPRENNYIKIRCQQPRRLTKLAAKTLLSMLVTA